MQGLELSARFYLELVRPHLSQIPHAAARLGSGSDILGLDDAVSRDHDWGCRLTLLMAAEHLQPIEQLLEAQLPQEFLGYPVRFATSWDERVRHRAEINTLHDFAISRLGQIPQTPVEWLLTPGQSILEMTAGPVFHDDTGQLTELRRSLQCYPQDVWLYVLACGWQRLTQELPLLQRTLQRGDRLGSEILSGRIGQILLHLAFMVEKRWPAYSKWTGSWLQKSEFGRQFTTLGRDQALAAIHEKLPGVTAPATEPFYGRGYPTANFEVARQHYEQIQDPAVAALPKGIGSVEQWSDNVNLAFNHQRRLQAAAIYQA